jgi:chromosome segregation ATPase
MNRSNSAAKVKETRKIDGEVVKQYQIIVKQLQEEGYNVKNALAVQEEIQKGMRAKESELMGEVVSVRQKELRQCLELSQEELQAKTKLIEHYEIEIKSLYCALQDAEGRSQMLMGEIEEARGKRKGSVGAETRFSSTLQKDIEATLSSARNARDSEAEYYKSELETKVVEVKYLESLIKEERNKFKKAELQQMIICKDDQIKSMNNRFIIMQAKIDGLRKEKEQLGSEKKNLELKVKSLSERWQQ